MPDVDATDARLLRALVAAPRASVLALAEALGLSRNTVQARLAALESRGVLGSFERRIDPAALGYPLTAFVSVQVVQRRLAEVTAALDGVAEVVQVLGLSGEADLLVQVVARDADDHSAAPYSCSPPTGWSARRRRWSCGGSWSTASGRCWTGSPSRGTSGRGFAGWPR